MRAFALLGVPLVSLLMATGQFSAALGQTAYSIGNPSNEAQYMLELINRARANGGAEATRLALSGLQEGPPTINGESWTIANSVQPLSWNVQLFNAAQSQATNLNNGDQFFLGVSPHTYGGMSPDQRIAATGYPMATYNGPTTTSGFAPGPENVAEAVTQGSGPFTGAKLIAGILQAHNDLFTDQTVPGRGHRETTMLGFFREAGIGVSVGTDNDQNPGQPGGVWDSLYIVQNFGTQTNGTPFITGVVYQDANGNGFYDPGEGIGGVRVDVTGSNFYAITASSGGYSVPVPGNGSFSVSFSGGGVTASQSAVTVASGANAKLDYVAVASSTPIPSPTPTLTPTPTPGASPGILGNISTRLQVGTGNNVLFAGFIVQGSATKKVLIRSAGPSLTPFGVPGVLANPQLELHNTSGTIGTNDNWQTTQLGGVITSDQVADIQASGAVPSNPAEPAIIATLSAGSYTAIVKGVSDTEGVATVELYDLTPNNGATLANISTRGLIQTGDQVMIGGFIVVGQPTKLIVRATGPSLVPFGINNALANPQLELHDANGTLARNDDWQTTQLGGIVTSDQSSAIGNSGLAPTGAAESAIIATLAPGNYTAIAQGVNGGIGVGLIEVYTLP